MKLIKTLLVVFVFGSIVFVPVISSAEVSSPTTSVNNTELQTQINSLMAQIMQLQQQLSKAQSTTVQWCYDFNNNLKIGDTNEEVYALNTALLKEGFGTGNEEQLVKYFSEGTASAVSGFQQKYASEILTPLGLKYGTGYVGKSTRAKLNKLYGCEIIPPVCIQVITPAKNPQTGECKNFSTPCDVPTGWQKVSECPVPTTSSITVLSPNGGETWTKGTVQTIKYQDNTPIVCSSAVCGSPTYDIRLLHYYPPCTTTICPTYIVAPYTIAKYTSGSSYDWSVGKVMDVNGNVITAPDGAYTVQVCQAGTSTCDSSNSYFKIINSNSLNTSSNSNQLANTLESMKDILNQMLKSLGI